VDNLKGEQAAGKGWVVGGVLLRKIAVDIRLEWKGVEGKNFVYHDRWEAGGRQISINDSKK